MTPQVMGYGVAQPACPSLESNVGTILSAPQLTPQCLTDVASQLSISSFAVGMFFGSVKQVIPTLRPEAVDTRSRTLCGLLDASRNRTSFLGMMGNFVVGDDWHRRPYRTRQTLFEVLDIAAVGIQFYKALGAQLPIQPVLNPMAYDPAFEVISSIPIEGSNYSLELWPGMQEAHGGFQFHIVSSQGELVCKIGTQLGSDTVSVVQIQGGGKKFSHHHDRLKAALGGQHPFDWLLNNLAHWCHLFGFRRLIGCGYRINSSLDKHLVANELPESRRPHLKKIYDDRFIAMGMRPHPELEDIFETDLKNWREKHDFPGRSDHTLTRLMNAALKPFQQ